VVYVVGEVGHPTGLVLELNQNMTVLRAIALAQGPTRLASLDQTRLIRNTPQGPVVTLIALKKILAAKAEDIPMQADDVLFIPASAGKQAWHGVQSVLGMAAGLGVRAY
jgi:polysaccharide export outer membrane protein